MRLEDMRAGAKAIFVVLIAASLTQGENTGTLPPRETLQYRVEWRLIHAGTVKVALQQNTAPQSPGGTAQLEIESAGIVAKLYKIKDQYRSSYEGNFCAAESVLNAQEGKRHRETTVKFDQSAKKATYLEKDLLKNTVVKQAEVAIPECVKEILGSLYLLRNSKLQPGQSSSVRISDGKKAPDVKVEAQEWEEITTKAGTFKTIRYEAHLFNGVLYDRNARAYIWISQDEKRLPVQIKLKLSLAVGTITLQLEKEERI
jgi:hypothetical protein